MKDKLKELEKRIEELEKRQCNHINVFPVNVLPTKFCSTCGGSLPCFNSHVYC